MSYRKWGSPLFGLLTVAALGVMSLATSAQAVTPLFNVNGSTNLHATISGEQIGSPGFLLVPAVNAALSCTTFQVQEGLLLSGGQVGHAKLLFENCRVFEIKNLTVELPCHVSDVADGKPELLHFTGKGVILPVEFADGTYGALIESLTAVKNFLSGTGCPLPLKNVFKGEICVRITAGNDTSKPTIRTNPTIQTECPLKVLEALGDPAGSKVKDKLLFGANEAFVDAEATLFATGAHLGATIGVLLL